MQSYIFPKLLRATLHPDCAASPAVRSARVNTTLLNTPKEDLARMGMRRARQIPKTPYEPFIVGVSDEALHVLRSLPSGVSRSALIQKILQ